VEKSFYNVTSSDSLQLYCDFACARYILGCTTGSKRVGNFFHFWYDRDAHEPVLFVRVSRFST
jgi:hypothetical protein